MAVTNDNNKVAKSWRLGPLKLSGGFRELVIIGIIYMTYRILSGSIPNTQDMAMQNSYKVVDVERFLKIFVETDFQSVFVNSTPLLTLANILYTICYYPALFLFCFWAYIRHRDQYYVVRNVFVVSAFIAFICFASFPVAPPRMLTDLGFVDTMKQAGSVDYGSPIARALSNPYAAMPSCHMGWTLLIGVATVCITKRWWLRVIGALVPTCMFVAIVATGNHFILDAIAGATVVGISYCVVRLYPRLQERFNKKRVKPESVEKL